MNKTIEIKKGCKHIYKNVKTNERVALFVLLNYLTNPQAGHGIHKWN